MALWVTPTSIKGLLSGDDQCEWAAWYRAHNYRYPKIESDFDFEAWRIQHNDLLKKIRTQMETDGYTVTVEKANKFKVEGATATVSGQIDIVGQRDRTIKIVDGKTGRRYDKDIWQVRIYIACFPLFAPIFNAEEESIIGEVHYLQGKKPAVLVTLTKDHEQRIWDLIRLVAGDRELARTPSPSECSFCDILNCPDRETAEELAGTSGGKF
jgi:hypothetical protein